MYENYEDIYKLAQENMIKTKERAKPKDTDDKKTPEDGIKFTKDELEEIEEALEKHHEAIHEKKIEEREIKAT